MPRDRPRTTYQGSACQQMIFTSGQYCRIAAKLPTLTPADAEQQDCLKDLHQNTRRHSLASVADDCKHTLTFSSETSSYSEMRASHPIAFAHLLSFSFDLLARSAALFACDLNMLIVLFAPWSAI